jgi:hypothetical protein
MTPEQRREYIAEKILKGKRINPSEQYEIDYSVPDQWLINGNLYKIDTDFESLPEWTGLICEVVLPMLAENGYVIWPIEEGLVRIGPWMSSLSKDFIVGKFSIALVDAHIKITGEKNV